MTEPPTADQLEEEREAQRRARHQAPDHQELAQWFRDHQRQRSIRPEVAVDDALRALRDRTTEQPGRIAPWDEHQLCRELAEGGQTHAELGRKYGVKRTAITDFKARHKRRIDEIAAHLDDEFAGLWVASKAARIAAHQRDAQLLEGDRHPERVKARTAILKQVAEELGQMPGRAGITITVAEHQLVGVEISEDLT